MPLGRFGKGSYPAGARRCGRYLLAALVVVLVAALFVFVFVQLRRPLPRLAVAPSLPPSLSMTGPRPSLPWPTQGEATLVLQGVGSLGSAGGDAPVPLASVTKVMTALLVLKDHPIAPGVQGPVITVTPADVATYASELALDESGVQVVAGEQLTEFEALEGLLLPSANNFADMLAVWDAGSVSAFVTQMNTEAEALGLTGTHYVEPSGFDPGNVGTASDQVHLAQVALENPTFASIVAEPEATLPVVGTIQNVDSDLGHDGIIGVKTGSESAAGGCFVFAAQQGVGGLRATITGAVLGQQGATPLTSALELAEQLVASAFSSLRAVTLLGRGQSAAHVVVPWSSPVSVTAKQAVRVIWPSGTPITSRARFLRPYVGLRRGSRLGMVAVTIGEEHIDIPLFTAREVPGPSLLWRLTHG